MARIEAFKVFSSVLQMAGNALMLAYQFLSFPARVWVLIGISRFASCPINDWRFFIVLNIRKVHKSSL